MENETGNNEVKVWDPLVRSFHWLLVISFTIAYITSEELEDIHIISGYVVCGLVLFRLVWGFVGSRYARFGNFIYGPAKVGEYLTSLKSSQPQHYLGHNPAGGWMVIVLLTMLVVVSYSGLKVYGLEGHGPLASQNTVTIQLISTAAADEDDDEAHEGGESAEEEFWEEIHEIASNLMLVLIAVHILGVIVSSRLHKENLVRAMIKGKKHRD